LWTPGYWAYDEVDGYYWVPGVWVRPPHIGYLWTPSYWGYSGGYYGWHAGYWGQHIGFYGGVNYGFGYCGSGFVGGRWEGGSFRYNTAVVNVNTTVIHNTYIDRTVVVNNNVNRTSFNGPGGVNARPNAVEQAAFKEQHVSATNEQASHQNLARQDKSQFASVNHGTPSTTAMNKVGGSRFTPHGSAAPAHAGFGHANTTVQNNSAVHNGGNTANNHPSAAQQPQHQQAARQQPQHSQAPHAHSQSSFGREGKRH
jgi:hypothetical protein